MNHKEDLTRMNLNDTLQIVLIGAGTGFGSTFGVEMARYLIETLKNRKKLVK